MSHLQPSQSKIKSQWHISAQFIPLLLLFIGIAIGAIRIATTPQLVSDWVLPKPIYNYKQHIQFSTEQGPAVVSTYLPENTDRQTILSQTISAPFTQQATASSANGLLSRWTAEHPASNIDISAKIMGEGIAFYIPSDLSIDKQSQQEWQHYLRDTDVIPVEHPEIEHAWKAIQPEGTPMVLTSLKAIYQYTSNLPTLPFKGTTDSLTALRLGAASCNGKSRLFVSLARHIGLPARLVGGVVLKEGEKRTSHQWVEINILDQWVPFDPTNKHFAAIPPHYLTLYWGDHALYSRSANIPFDYLFDISLSTVAPALESVLNHQDVPALQMTLAQVFNQLEVPSHTSAIFLMLPLCTLMITVLRNVVGISTFGTFMPMLIASACAAMGLVFGLVGFLFILIIATVCSVTLNALNLLKIPRLAILVTVVNLAGIALLSQFKQFNPFELGVMSLFPVIIISFIADSLSELIEEKEWTTLCKEASGTFVSIIMCFLAMQSTIMQGIFAVFPEAYLVILAGLMSIGQWTGLKLSELIRFKDVLKKDKEVLGINARNSQWVSKYNSTKALKLATDKLATKTKLNEAEIPSPDTLAIFSRPPSFEQVAILLKDRTNFVIKPNQGSQGKGIVVIGDCINDTFYSVGGKPWSMEALHQHIVEIVCGKYSGEKADSAYIEPRITQCATITELAPYGLADIRVIALEKRILCAMLRLPTKLSDGKANLHQGAVGASIDLEKGTITGARLRRHVITHHPDSNMNMQGFPIPHWERVMEIAQQCAQTNDLGYMGIDICIDEQAGPMVLEINGRPGLEVQNVHGSSMQSFVTPPSQFSIARV